MITGSTIQSEKEKAVNLEGLGMDVSHHNVGIHGGALDWSAAFSAGFRFVFVKATDGVNFVDPEFINSAKNARAAGLSVGAYHFLRPGDQSLDQAASLLKAIARAGGAGLFDLGVAVDVEDPSDDPGAWNRLAKSERVEKVLHWIEGVKDIFPTPMIYCSPRWWAGCFGDDPAFGDYPLWAASWGRGPDLAGTPWKSCELWQYESKGTVPGIGTGNVDLNRSGQTSTSA